MEYSSAEMTCILKINTQCEACKAKVMQVLRNIGGVYNITIDGELGTVRVTGRVNPSTLLGVLEKYGKHAEVKYIKFDGEVVERRSLPYFGECGYNAPHGMEHSYPLLAYPQHHCYLASLPPPPPPPPPCPPPLAPLYPPRPLPPPLWPPPTRPHGPPPLAPLWPQPPPPPPNHAPRGGTSGPNKAATEQNNCAMM